MSDKKPYKVMVVEDQSLTREFFTMIIEKSQDYDLLYSVESASVAKMYADRYDIDLILMDVIMDDGSNGLIEAERIKKSHPDIKIIIVTSMPEVSFLDQARVIGVDSFWYKETQKEPILSVMKRTMAGESIYPTATPSVSIGYSNNHEFSERELEILRELITGDSNAEIGERLGITPSTVKYHVQNMLDKTGMHTRTELAVVARSLGIVIR